MKNRIVTFARRGVALLAVSSAPCLAAIAENTVVLSGDVILRYDAIDQESLPESATALTMSGRFAAEWQPNKRFTALLEVEGNGALIDDFSDTPGAPLNRPFIPDPDHIDVNRLQVQARLHDEAFITLGRQMLVLDDQRFLGMAGFRQNRRSFDAVRVTWRDGNSNTYQLGYFNKVNRPLGNRTPLGEFDSNSWFANVNLETLIGRVGLFHYAFDLETGPSSNRSQTASSATTGIRFDGRYHQTDLKLDVEASYAQQKDYGDNPNDYSADYWLLGLTTFLNDFELNGRAEILGADDQQSFQTPLASLHKFHGEADVFLSTPIDGLIDLSAGVKYNGGKLGPFTDVTPSIRVHQFEAERNGTSYGTEIDLGVSAKLSDLSLKLTFADYRADAFSSDRTRAILSIGKRF